MNINRYQAAKNLQPARSLRTAPNAGRNALGDFGYPPHLVDTSHQARAGPMLNGNQQGILPAQTHQRSSSQSRKHDVLRTPTSGSHASGAGRSSATFSPGSLTFNASTLTIGSLYEVTVSYVQNGPKQFMVQLRSSEVALKQMMGALARVPLRSINRKLQLGMACLARYTHNHTIYRALITALGQDGNCTVTYVDYGHSETVHPSNLYEIPPEFLRYEIFSTRFALSNVRRLEDVNADVAGIFSKMIAGKVLTLKVTPPEGAAFVSYCELYENGDNLFLRLQQQCQEQVYKYPPPGSLQRGPSYRVVIRYIESCAKFFVHRLDNVAAFDKMMDDLIVHCQGSGSVVPGVVNVGDVYAVSLDPNDIYRAEVIETDPKLKVRLIDYGTSITTQRSQLKRLSPDFLHQRPEAIECCLEGFEGSISADLSTDQLEMLAEGTDRERKPFKLIVYDIRDGKTIVNLLDESETPVLNVSKKLLKLNNPGKFIKEQQSNPQKQQNKRLSGGAGANGVDPLGTSVDSAKAQLSSSGISSGHGDCIDLTNDEWSGGPPLPGNQSSGYDLQAGANVQSPPRNGRSGGGGAGYGRESNNSSRDSSTGNNKQDAKRNPGIATNVGTTAGVRNDIPRFNKDRAQMPYYYEHDDRFAEPNSPPANVGLAGNEAKRNERNRMDAPMAAAGESNAFVSSNAQSSDEFMPYRSTFPEQAVTMSTKHEVVLSWWYSPEQFYVRLRSDEDKYHEMMKQLQKYYRNKSNQQVHQQQLQQQQQTSGKAAKPSTGSIVVVRHPKHNAYYRGRVLKYNESVQKYKVELVDGGNKLALSINDLWLVERRFTRLAPMAIACALPDVRLRCEVKELQSRIDSYISNDKQFETIFLERVDGKYHCKVESLGRDLKEHLLEDDLIAQVYVDIDLTRLKGQTLKVQLVELKSLNDFRAKLLGHQAIFSCRQDDCDSSLSSADALVKLRAQWLNRHCLAQVVDVSNDEKLILSLLIPSLTGQPEPTIAEMPVLMSTFNVYVTHVESTNCLYVQNARWSEQITKMADDLFEFYEKQQELVPVANLAMNEMCAAKSQDDGNWYRAKIVSLQEIEKIEVLLVDYGYREQVKHSELKVLEPKFLEYSAFAHRVYLPMAAIADVNEERIKNEISELTGSYELSLKVVEFRNGIWIVDITSNDYSIVSVLKDRQLVADLDYETILNQRQASSPTPGAPVRPSIEDHEAKHQKIKAKICHVDNPSQLFIQLESDEKDLNQLQETLQIIASSLPPLRDFSADRYCIAQYSADDLWYRALIIDSHDDLIIQFVDFGHTDIVTSNKKSTLRDINDDLMKWKIYAKQCAMLIQPMSAEVAGTDGGQVSASSSNGRKKMAAWKEVATTILRALDEVEVQFLAEAQGVHYISVRSSEKDIAEMLVEKKLATRLLYVPSGQRCFTSHTESIDEFYLQLERDVNPLDMMANYLADVSKFADVEEPKVNMICLAEFADDGLWYRVQVLAIPQPGTYEVLFVDYGNGATVQKLKQLEPSIAELTRLCTKCALRLPENVKSWSAEAQEKFVELTAMGQTVFTVQLHSPGPSFATVELFLEGRNIVDQLVALCEKGPGSSTDAMSSSFFLGDDNRLDDSYQLEDDKVHISHVNSPAEFFIQFNNSFDALRNMEELLASKAKHCEPIAEGDIRNGLFCLAQLIHNGKYCRALVLSEVHGGQATYHLVLLVDYGYRAAATDLRKMPPSIEEMSRLAKKCCLEHYLPTDEVSLGAARWSRLRSRLTELADSGKAVFTFEIVRNDCDPLIIRLFTPAAVNVEDLLREKDVDDTIGAPVTPDNSGSSSAEETQRRAKPKQAFFRALSDLEFLENCESAPTTSGQPFSNTDN
ncbi:maternal protein tudor [Anopheles funestus]|uniref:maternal protein tudor n=1 Tax=Anopheles funestus TaxID=62324 RepID=UPI0020C5D7A2|nr:maternal protein tudor [Anopheles funestus]XP_049283840.1 maternal protein tudor [Anopheles funestus]